MKPVKAIDLVWKAQPAMSLLREILIRNRPNDSLISHLDEWLAQSNELLARKEKKGRKNDTKLGSI